MERYLDRLTTSNDSYDERVINGAQKAYLALIQREQKNLFARRPCLMHGNYRINTRHSQTLLGDRCEMVGGCDKSPK